MKNATLLMLALALVTSGVVPAQVPTGGITGFVADGTGARLPVPTLQSRTRKRIFEARRGYIGRGRLQCRSASPRAVRGGGGGGRIQAARARSDH